MRGIYFDEVEVGATFETARLTVTEEAIIRFAFEWDPQPFHIDRLAAAESLFGGLVASGLHTIMTTYRLYYDHGLLKSTAVAGLGFDEIRFKKPLRPNDTIRVVIRILEKLPSSKPGRGHLRLGLETVNQEEETIMSFILNAIVACRPEPAGP